MGNLIADRLDGWLRERLAGTPADKVCEPAPYLTGQVLMQLPFVAEEETLRDLYVQLLANGMHADRRSSAHPSYVDIIRQLTPDEARLLPLLKGKRHFPIVEARVSEKGKDGWGHEQAVIDFGALPNLSTPSMFGVYFRNFERAKLIEVDFTKHLIDDSFYEPILNGETIAALRAAVEPKGRTLSFQKGRVEVTEFGSGFIDACLPRDKP